MKQISMFDIQYPHFYFTKPIRLIELFAGIGSQAKAMKNIDLDFTHYRICEFDKYAVLSYNAIHGTDFQTSDITKINASDLAITGDYDYVLTYSFPCTDLSVAGKQAGMSKGSGTRSGLLWEVERLLKQTKELPQVLLMENVPDVIGKKNIKDFNEWQAFLESLGYKNYVELLNAKHYGIPQNRNRAFMVSILGDYSYEFPKRQKLKLRLKDFLEEEVDEKYYLSAKLLKHIDKTGISNGEYIQFERYNGQFESLCRVWLKFSPTLHTKSKDIIIYDGENYRHMTNLECWRLMGFTDDDFEKASKVNSNSQLYKQAGNSIVVQVLEAIFKQMKRRNK